MLNRINQLFQDSPKNLLSIYFCAGCPNLDGTADVIRALERNGVSMIEIGIPFSDPMADGIVIQNAATRALHNGMSLRLLFEQLRDIRRDVRIPLVLMGYLNPIMQFGFEAFCQKCVECGIDGVIIPDLPFRDYEESYKAIASKYDIRVIMLITPRNQRSPRPRNRRPHRRIHLSGVQCRYHRCPKRLRHPEASLLQEDRGYEPPQSTHGRLRHQQQADIRCRLRPLIRCHHRQPLRHAAQREGRRCGKGYQAVEGRFETVSLFKFHTIYFSQ